MHVHSIIAKLMKSESFATCFPGQMRLLQSSGDAKISRISLPVFALYLGEGVTAEPHAPQATGACSRTPTPPVLPCATATAGYVHSLFCIHVRTNQPLVLFAACILLVKVQFHLQLCLGESLSTVMLPRL